MRFTGTSGGNVWSVGFVGTAGLLASEKNDQFRSLGLRSGYHTILGDIRDLHCVQIPSAMVWILIYYHYTLLFGWNKV